MLMRVSPDFDAQAKARADAASERVQAWEALMSTFQQPLPWAGAGQKRVPMQRIFDLAECAD
jgi:L-rhamnose mutarotase